MTLDELRQHIQDGKTGFIKQEPQKQEQKQADPLQDFLQVLIALRKPKLHLTSEPTFTPKNFLEQIQFVDDGVDQYLALYINGNWYSFPGTLIP